LSAGVYGGLPAAELLRLDAALRRALETGDESGLDILGYGEISSVVAWKVGDNRYACKRLPPFRDGRHVSAYRSVFEAYLAALRERGLQLVESVLQTVEQDGPGGTAWCIQPIHPAGIMVPTYFRECGRDDATAILFRMLDHIGNCVDAGLGLDGQISNWVLVEGELLYLDVTTPLMRDETGVERLDTELFLASLPWALRGLGRAMLRGIVDKYYERRGVVLDLLGNLYKERLSWLLPAFLAHANTRVSPPLTPDEVSAYYASDARAWAFLQRLRRIDRFWQQKVCRQTYPFLLPGVISR
jgi:hypothetical protein